MKRTLQFVLSLWVLLLLGHVALAQTRIVTGTVTDTKNQPVIGASVVATGTTTGTYTDVDGKFTLAVPDGVNTLTIKYLGMRAQELAIGTAPLAVSLQPDVLGLEEVVVTAVGISRERKSLGYAVQNVGSEELRQAGESNTLNALSGKVAGLQIIQSSGSPGSATMVRLRGATSITGTNSPLIVVDGVPLDNSENYSGNPDNVGGNLNNNSLENVNNSNRGIDVNPEDIENITVLKGPAATALYGINAAGGAIVITTKKGGKKVGGGLAVSYSTNMSFETVNKLPELQDMYVKGNSGQIASYGSTSSASFGALGDTLYWDPSQPTPYNQFGELIGATEAAGVSGAKKYEPYDNMGDFFKTGRTWEHNLSFSGGTDNSGYRFSFSALNQDGIIPLSSFDRYTGKIAGSTMLSPKFTTSGSVSYVKSGGRRIQQGSNLSGLMLDLLRNTPSFQISNGVDDPEDPSSYILEDGTQRNYRGGVGYDNPYWTINQNPFNDDVNRVFGFAQLDYKTTKWLNFTYRIGTDVYSDVRRQFYAINSGAHPSGQIWEQHWNHRHINSDLIANLTHKFGDSFGGTLTLGQNIFAQRHEQFFSQGDNLAFPDFQHISVASDVQTRQETYLNRTYAYYAQLSLDYRAQVYLNLTGRNEWTSTLEKGNNSFFYPSVSLSWVASETFGLTNNKILPFAKFRVSYAQVGRDAPPYATGNYYASAFAQDGWTSGVPFPQNGVTGYASGATLGNPDLVAEKTGSFEIGAELKSLNNRLGLDIAYYKSSSTNQIILAPIAQSAGYQYQFVNSGQIDNRGVELQLTATPIRTDNVEWSLGVNWGFNRGEVKSLAEGVNEVNLGGFEGTSIYAVVGEQYGSIYGTRYLRDPGTGKVVVDDQEFFANGDPNPEYGRPIIDPQTGILGNVNPDWIAGLSTSLSVKGFTLNVLFDVRQGGDIWNGTRGALNNFGMSVETEDRGSSFTFPDAVMGHIDDDGGLVVSGDNNISFIKDQSYYQGIGSGFVGPAEQFIEDGSYIKLRELSLYYDFAKAFVSKTPFRSLSVGFIGRNLWLSTDYSGVDPETSLTGSNNSSGMDYFNMPNSRSLGFTVRVGL